MHGPLRLLDANRNRALEALRTLEDLARFQLGREDLCRRCRELRHGLLQATQALEPSPLAALAARDAQGDPGRTAGGGPRTTIADLAAAAAGRLKEALRVLEELARVLAPDPAAELEALRYEAYQVEALIRLAFQPAARLEGRRLMLILDPLSADPGENPTLRDAILDSGQVDLVQLRMPQGDDRRRLAAIANILERARPRDIPVIINDRTDLAAASGADGVHLGAGDLPPRAARQLLGEGAIIGATVHDQAELAAALAAGADYAGIGPCHRSPTKPELEPAPQGRLAELAAACPIPAFAIGGITAERWPGLARLGFSRCAIRGAVVGAGDPIAALGQLRRALDALSDGHGS